MLHASSRSLLLAVLFAFLLMLEAFVFIRGAVRSSKSLHFLCLNTLMHAPVSWFDGIPSGRIISRFTSDISVVDLFLPRFIDYTVQFLMTVVLFGVVLVVVLPWFLPVLLVCFILFGLQLAAAMGIAKDAKRAANVAMNPVQSTLTEIQQGRENHSNARFSW